MSYNITTLKWISTISMDITKTSLSIHVSPYPRETVYCAILVYSMRNKPTALYILILELKFDLFRFPNMKKHEHTKLKV